VIKKFVKAGIGDFEKLELGFGNFGKVRIGYFTSNSAGWLQHYCKD